MPTLPLLAAALFRHWHSGGLRCPSWELGRLPSRRRPRRRGARRGRRGAPGGEGGRRCDICTGPAGNSGGAASALQPSGALAKRTESSDTYAIVPAVRLAGAPPEGQEVKAGELPEAAAPAAVATERPPQAWAWAAFAPLFAALGRANLAVRQQTAGRAASRISGAVQEGAAYGGADMSDSLLAVMSLQGDYRQPCLHSLQ
jgi:hypothetical protein